MVSLIKTDFGDLPGWKEHDHKAALAAFRDSARHLIAKPPKTRADSVNAQDLLAIANKALASDDSYSSAQAQHFFETEFTAYALPAEGLLTGYYEPVFDGSLRKSEAYPFPLHKRPDDLTTLSSKQARSAGFTEETSFARETADGLTFHYSRGEVMSGALEGQGLELVWLKNAIDAYIIHIQGSARIKLEDGSTLRVAFDGKSGHPYRSIGKVLIERGVFSRESITMEKLMDYVGDLGEEGLMLLAENPSYIYFKRVPPLEGRSSDLGPIAAANIPLLPLRSIAVDRHIHTFGLPFWIDSTLPDGQSGSKPFQQLVFAHDTGSAIKGAARADLFVGSGEEAGRLAGQLQQKTRFFCLMPNPTPMKGA